MWGNEHTDDTTDCTCGHCGWCVAVELADGPTTVRRAGMTQRLFARPRRAVITVLALGVASAAIVFGSFAAWTAQTTNPGNSVTTGTLALTNNKNATSIFAATGVLPGGTGTSTVAITNSGGSPLAVSLTQDQLTTTGVEASLGLKIHDTTRNWCVYPVAAAGACAATYGAWNGAATLTNLALPATDGSAKWPAGQAHTFTLSWQLATTSVNTDQGKTGSFRLVWNGAQ